MLLQQRYLYWRFLEKIKMDEDLIRPKELKYFGCAIGKYEMPTNLIKELNVIFDEHKDSKKLFSYGQNLAGQIKEEWDVLNLLNKDVIQFFKNCIFNYLYLTVSKPKVIKKISINSCWFNDQKENEYNPLHSHSGKSILGVSSVLFLKIPLAIKNAKQKNENEGPTDGRLQFVSGVKNFFTVNTYRIDPVVGDFYLFPYELPHTVYAFKGEGIRRSLSFNADIYL